MCASPVCHADFTMAQWQVYLEEYGDYICCHYIDEDVVHNHMNITMAVHHVRAMLHASKLSKYKQLHMFGHYFLKRLDKYPGLAPLIQQYREKLCQAQIKYLAADHAEGFRWVSGDVHCYWNHDEYVMSAFVTYLPTLVMRNNKYFDAVANFVACQGLITLPRVRAACTKAVVQLKTLLTTGVIKYNINTTKFNALCQQHMTSGGRWPVIEPKTYHSQCTKHIQAVVTSSDNCEDAYLWLQANQHMRPAVYDSVTDMLCDVLYAVNGRTTTWFDKLREVGHLCVTDIKHADMWCIIKNCDISPTYLAVLVAYVAEYITTVECMDINFITDFILQVGRARIRAVNPTVLGKLRTWTKNPRLQWMLQE